MEDALAVRFARCGWYLTYTLPLLELSWDAGPLESQAPMCLRLLSSRTHPLMGYGIREELKNSSNHALWNIVEDAIGFASTMQYFWSGFTDITLDRDWMWAKSSALMHRLLSLQALSSPGRSPDSEADENS